MKKVLFLLIIQIFLFASTGYSMESKLSLYGTHASHYAIGDLGEDKIILISESSRNPEPLDNEYLSFTCYILAYPEYRFIDLQWESEITMNTEYDEIELKFCDFDHDGIEELLISKSYGDRFGGKLYVYKIDYELKVVKLIWKNELPGSVSNMMKISNNNILLQVDDGSNSYLYVIGYNNNIIDIVWSRMLLNKKIHYKYITIAKENIFILNDNDIWEQIILNNNKIKLFPISDEMQRYLSYMSLDDMEISEKIGFVDLNGNGSLDVLHKKRDGHYSQYYIHDVESNIQCFEQQIPTLDLVIGYICSDDKLSNIKIIFKNGYSIYWKDEKYVYEPWNKTVTLSADFKMWDLQNVDIDNDGVAEILYLQGNADFSLYAQPIELCIID